MAEVFKILLKLFKVSFSTTYALCHCVVEQHDIQSFQIKKVKMFSFALHIMNAGKFYFREETETPLLSVGN